MTVADTVDGLLIGPAVVFGSLPPDGRDLDLVCDRDVADALTRELSEAAFTPVAGSFARVRGCGEIDVVDVTTTERWGLSDDASRRLLERSVPLPGYRWLRVPSPGHAIIILARRTVRTGSLDQRRLERLRAAEEEDASAWTRANEEAPAWRAVGALRILERVRRGEHVPRWQRLRALAHELAPRTRLPAARWVMAWRRSSARAASGMLVSFSGIEGSGKSTQTRALAATLETLGLPTTIVWRRLTTGHVLRALSALVRGVLRRITGREWQTRTVQSVIRTERPADPEMDRSSARVATRVVWSTLVSVNWALAQRREVNALRRRGTTVICDRHILDAAVHLRFRYGSGVPTALSLALLRLLAPRADASFLLDVPAETSWARRRDQYDVAQLAIQVDLYREECDRWNVHRLPGDAAPDALCERISRVVIERLRTAR